VVGITNFAHHNNTTISFKAGVHQFSQNTSLAKWTQILSVFKGSGDYKLLIF
jgi:hypothetical protein